MKPSYPRGATNRDSIARVTDPHAGSPLASRSGGVLLHPTSLPGAGPSGNLGTVAYRFAERLASTGLSWWQTLPVGPVDPWRSPYSGPSAFAGNASLIAPEPLVAQGLLRADEATGMKHEETLRRAFDVFEAMARGALHDDFEAYCAAQEDWLEDHALYTALRSAHGGRSWTAWDAPIRDREPAALARARRNLEEQTRFERFVQFLFDRQWDALRDRCRELGLRLLGDVPFYVAHESADVWSRAPLFLLDGQGRPTSTAGVPPDYFNEEGQWWGNPLYRWDRHRDEGYAWWIARLGRALARFDAVRLDHFIAIHNYWEIPDGARSAREGRWAGGPGVPFLQTVFQRLDVGRFVAEDLGAISDAVRDLRDRFGLPGMRVIQFGFDGDPDNEHLPHRYPPGCVAYTGTHDNNTSAGWFEQEAGPSRLAILEYLGSDGRAIHRDLARAVFASQASVAILPAQDLLGLGSAARMNRPGVIEGNWTWRMSGSALPDDALEWLQDLAARSGRGR